MEPVQLQSTHASAVASLWLSGVRENARAERAYLPAVSQEEYAATIVARLANGSIFGWVIVLPSPPRLVAYLMAELKESAPEFVQRKYLNLLDLDVRQAERRNGYGTSLVEAAKRYSKKADLSSIEVNWVTADVQASAFWQRQGFSPYLSRARLSAAVFASDA